MVILERERSAQIEEGLTDSSSIFGPNMALEAIDLRMPNFKHFAGGACPLACSHLSAHNARTSLK